MRTCWNWQTGMTKDHVPPGRSGSSPVVRRRYPESEKIPVFFYFVPLDFLFSFLYYLRAEKERKYEQVGSSIQKDD